MNDNFTSQVFNLLNEERTNRDLDPLRVDSQLSQAAQEHSDSMAAQDFFSHTGADGSSPFERIEEEGYQYSIAGENIAAGYQTPEEVVTAWMGSDGHRENILNPNFTEIGIGYNFTENDTGSVNYNHYWTTDFGTPL